MNHGSAGIQLQNEFAQLLYKLVQASWKVDKTTSRQGKIVLTSPTGVTITTSQPTSRADFLDLRSKCIQMGLR